MQTTQKINELLSKNYNSNISILGKYNSSIYTSILDTNNGTIFIASNYHLFSFKDQNQNHWLTAEKSFGENKQQHPKLGDLFTLNNGVQYIFTTKEVIVAMAIAYFEKHHCL
ncbi:hypothetical protein ACHRVZ_11935 [Flavobacterium sp. FlaQc-57]|uniref:hypothetical protein n=1 Tax=Flavobacterium sp. FlaQc-57 TaxID=3374186 RepID=UPI00375817D0